MTTPTEFRNILRRAFIESFGSLMAKQMPLYAGLSLEDKLADNDTLYVETMQHIYGETGSTRQITTYLEDTYVGCIRKEFTFLRPKFTLDCNGWYVEGQFLEWDYRILDGSDRLVATITKEILHWTDTYVIDVTDAKDALHALMFVLAIDAEKCSRN